MENISCPRCRKTFKHAQELMKEVKSIDRNIVMGICDHCTKKAQTIKKPFCVCDKIVKKFNSSIGEQKEDIENHVKTGFLKSGSLFKDSTMLKKPQQIKRRVYSDPQINLSLASPVPGHGPEIQPLFANAEMRENDLKIGYKTQSVTFLQPKPMETPLTLKLLESGSETIVPGKSFVDSDNISNVDVQKLPRTSLKNRKQEEIIEDTPSMDAKQELIRRHDLSLRQMMRPDKDSRVPYSDTSVYETSKTAPWEQKEIKHQMSDMDTKPTKTKHVLDTRDLNDVSNRRIKYYGSSRTSRQDLRDSLNKPKKADKYYDDRLKKGLYDSEKKSKTVMKLEDRRFTDEELHLQRSEDKVSRKMQIAKSKSVQKKPIKVVEPQFSFFFPKLKEKRERKIKLDVPSSQLVKDIQKKLHLQPEGEKKGQEERRQQKLVQDQAKKLAQEEKKLAREEKKLQVEEKTRQAAEEKKYMEDFEKELVGEENKDIVRTKRDKKSRPEQRDLKEKPKRKSMDDDLMMMKALKSQKEQKRDEKNKLKPRPQQEDKIDEVFQKTKKDKIEVLQKTKEGVEEKSAPTEKGEKNELKEKPKRKSMDDDLMMMKALKSQKEQQKDEKNKLKHKPQQEDKIDEVLQKTKKDKIGVLEKTKESVKEKSAPAEKGKKNDLKKKLKRKSMDDDLNMMKAWEDGQKEKQGEKQISELEKSNKVEAKSKQKDKDAEKEQKIKTAQEESIEKAKIAKENAERLQLIAQLREQKQKERTTAKGKVKEKELAELKMCDVKLFTGTSMDNLILSLVKIKQAAMKMKPNEISAFTTQQHLKHHRHECGFSSATCPLCLNSDLELDVLSLDNRIQIPAAIITDIVKGEKILKLQRLEKTKEPEVDAKYPKVFFPGTTQPPKDIVQITEQTEKLILFSKMNAEKVEVESSKGILRYALSDRTFIEKGWTMLPTEKVVRKMNVYRMRPAHPEFDWFEHNKNKGLMTYDTGERLAEFDDNGRGRWYYRSGRLALDYYDAEGGYLPEFYGY